MFEQKVSARKFASTKVDVFDLPEVSGSSQSAVEMEEEKVEIDHLEK